MPPGIIADINSVSARQRDSIRTAHAGALICIKARVRESSAVRRDDRSGRRVMMPASPPAHCCISISLTHRFFFLERLCGRPLQSPLVDTLEHFGEM
jgi:hypothetical protein